LFTGGMILSEGVHTISTHDKAGFKFNSTVIIDYTAPIITIDPYPTNPTNQNITVTAYSK
jgi:hypothetical protein